MAAFERVRALPVWHIRAIESIESIELDARVIPASPNAGGQRCHDTEGRDEGVARGSELFVCAIVPTRSCATSAGLVSSGRPRCG